MQHSDVVPDRMNSIECLNDVRMNSIERSRLDRLPFSTTMVNIPAHNSTRATSLCIMRLPDSTTMNTAAGFGASVVPSALKRARSLTLPSRELVLRRDPSVYKFWETNESLLEQAWGEWSKEEALPDLDDSLYHPALREAVEASWKNPDVEHRVRDLIEEVAPGVYKVQFFDPEQLPKIRAYLDKAGEAGIPVRPPYGIVLNRKGYMIDPRSVGYLAIPPFQDFYRDVVDTYMRPLGRLLFPDYVQTEDDTQSFSFSIQYQAGKDQSIREHSDASSLTLNINLNLPGEEWTGSSLYFKDRTTGEKSMVDFEPGTAVIHRGPHPHAAVPITSGERSNWVLWLSGESQRYFPYDYHLDPTDRWVKPSAPPMKPTEPHLRWSPF